MSTNVRQQSPFVVGSARAAVVALGLVFLVGGASAAAPDPLTRPAALKLLASYFRERGVVLERFFSVGYICFPTSRASGRFDPAARDEPYLIETLSMRKLVEHLFDPLTTLGEEARRRCGVWASSPDKANIFAGELRLTPAGEAASKNWQEVKTQLWMQGERSKSWRLPGGRQAPTAVTGISRAGADERLLVEFDWDWEPLEFGGGLPGGGKGSAVLRLFDDGWRVASVQAPVRR